MLFSGGVFRDPTLPLRARLQLWRDSSMPIHNRIEPNLHVVLKADTAGPDRVKAPAVPLKSYKPVGFP